MPKPAGYIMTPDMYESVREVGRDVRRNRATRKARRSPRPITAPGALRYAKLTEDLDAATSFLTGATTATADLVEADPDNDGDLKVGTVEITVTNRWTDLELSSGKYVVVCRIANEWVIVASECP